MSHLPVVSSDRYRLFHGPCNPEISPEMSQAPGSLLPAPARVYSGAAGHRQRAGCVRVHTSLISGEMSGMTHSRMCSDYKKWKVWGKRHLQESPATLPCPL